MKLLNWLRPLVHLRRRRASVHGVRSSGSGGLPYVAALFSLAPAFGALNEVAAAELDVTITGVKAGAGSVRVALYRDPASFRHEDKAFAVLSAAASATPTKLVFQGVPPGRYAVLAYHDQNDNKKLDLTLGMFPREGWGLSNNPHVFGPPRFEASAFDVTESVTNIFVPLHY